MGVNRRGRSLCGGSGLPRRFCGPDLWRDVARHDVMHLG